ncbi:hypothetical protein GCM10027162_41840 [Streptomyces incanus]
MTAGRRHRAISIKHNGHLVESRTDPVARYGGTRAPVMPMAEGVHPPTALPGPAAGRGHLRVRGLAATVLAPYNARTAGTYPVVTRPS